MNQTANRNQDLQTLLTAFAESLASLPLESPEWELLPEFIEQLQEKVSTHEVQLAAYQAEEAEQRAALREELETLCQENSEILDFFGFIGCMADWALEQIPYEQIRPTLEQTRRLFYTLQQYQELEQALRAAESVQTKRELRSQITDQEDQILELIAKLKLVLPSPPVAESGGTDAHLLSENADIDQLTVADQDPAEVVAGDTATEAVDIPTDETALGNELIEPVDDWGTEISILAEDERDWEETSIIEPVTEQSAVSTGTVEATTEKAEAVEIDGNAPDIVAGEVIAVGAPSKPVGNGVTSNMVEVPSIEEEGKWRQFFWQLVAEGDVPGAYWLNQSLAMPENSIAMPVPDWLLAAVQGTWWLSSTRGLLTQDMADLAFGKTVGDTPNEKFTAISAALLPALMAPSTGLGTWLYTDARLPETFNEIITAVKEFNFYNRTLRRNDVLIIRGEDNRQQVLDNLQKKAKRWLEEAPQRRAPILKRAGDVWYSWTRPNGDLRRMMDIVASNATSRTEQLRTYVEEWRALSVAGQINQTDAKNMGTRRPKNPMVGPPRNWLVNQAEESLQLVEEWLELIAIDDEQAGWYLKQVESLLHQIKKSKDRAFQQLLSLEKSCSGEIAPATISLLRWALVDVCQYLELEIPSEEQFHPRPFHTFPQGLEPGLYSGLYFRLFWLPEVKLNSNFDVMPQNLYQVAASIYQTHSQRTLADAYNLFIERQDYRFIPIILQNEPDVDEQKYRESLSASKLTFGRNHQTVEDFVEQAVIEGILDDDARARFESELVELEHKEEIQNYGSLLSRLNKITVEIEEQRASHLQHQGERWAEIDARLQQLQIDASAYTTIANYMRDALAKHDVVVTDERLARLEEILDSGGVPEQDEFQVVPERDIYREFVSALDFWEAEFKNISLQQIARNLSIGRYDPVLQFEYTLPRPREIEVSDTFKKWYELKKTLPSNRVNVTENIITILQYLSFTFLKLPSRSITWKQSERDWVYLSIDMSGGNLSPVPQFGSQQPKGFDVICLWERPGAELIGSRLHNLKLSFNNVIVLYLGRLTKLHRMRLQHFTREHSLSLAVLDELLLMFLARETDSRLGAFLRCALPLASVNPYAETGPVYPEMFFGRVDERKSLQEPAGYALVHGGRQLGKSALLQQVEREFNSPDNERYVYREDIKFIGDPASRQSDPELLWEHLRRGLESIKLLPESSASKPETIIDKIKQMMAKHPSRRILVLFDEADNFLAADLNRKFETVSKLKALMDDTQRRFKVIFAGLHIVQRYEGIPNQPLAHLPNLLVRPLEPQSALQLIRQPLEALGFRFPEKDMTPLLGILAYTNYHPGLIQLFCQKLLNKMYQERPRDIGPFIITREHVEAVYRQPEVREGIRRRFEWTLALDERYKVLTQLMVLDQIEIKDGYSALYSVDDLSTMARSYWPQAFENSTRDAFKGYLDEMAGLGVLVRNQEGNYRLRSPNLVRLLGSQDDLWSSLSELTSKNIVSTLVDDSHRPPLDDPGSRYSPFTYQQSRVLNAKRYGVGLVFGSKALNIDDVRNAIEDHFVPKDSSGKIRERRITSERGDAFSQWLAEQLERNPDKERLVIYRYIGGMPNIMAEQVTAALQFCARRQRSQRQWMRILFIFDSVATSQWLQLPLPQRTEIEEQVDALVTIRPWDEVGIVQRLTQHDKIGSEQTAKQIMQDLNGWPCLIDKLADKWGSSNDPIPACHELRSELLDITNDAALQFLSASGWDVGDKIKQVLQTIAVEDDGVPKDMLVPAILGENLTNADCIAITEYSLRMNLLHQTNTDVFVDPILRQILRKNEP